jgi:DNA-binding PadR family transcriptional regulator
LDLCTATALRGALSRFQRICCKLNQGTLYPALLRLQQRGWIKSEWGTSENNRKAKFYQLSPAGRRQLTVEAKNWEQISGVMARLLGSQEG